MPSLKANFDELMERIRQGRELGHASFEPIYYLIFDPAEILDVKRELPAWTSRLANAGWDVHRFSMAQEVSDILQNAPLMKIWLSADTKAPLAWEKTNQSLSNAVIGPLMTRLEACLDGLQGNSHAILLITDLEALHPYGRIGSIEGQLYGKFCAPTIIFYPGKRTGKTRLKFLNFYPEDGNYRSYHVGG